MELVNYRGLNRWLCAGKCVTLADHRLLYECQCLRSATFLSSTNSKHTNMNFRLAFAVNRGTFFPLFHFLHCMHARWMWKKQPQCDVRLSTLRIAMQYQTMFSMKVHLLHISSVKSKEKRHLPTEFFSFFNSSVCCFTYYSIFDWFPRLVPLSRKQKQVIIVPLIRECSKQQNYFFSYISIFNFLRSPLMADNFDCFKFSDISMFCSCICQTHK